MNVGIVGGGDLGSYIKATISEIYGIPKNTIILFDDGLYSRNIPSSRPFISFLEDDYRDFDFFIGLGYKHPAKKLEIIQALLNKNRNVPSFVHPDAYVHESVVIGHGCLIYSGCTIDRNTMIGDGTCIINSVTVSHDCRIGSCCYLGPNVTLSGRVTINDRSFLGSGSIVANDRIIGNDVIIGLGTCVTRDINPGNSVIGNPMRILDKRLEL
jgi:sugar O-acyltransferase (sialic acid O-acetyltransferase NeuD family)